MYKNNPPKVVTHVWQQPTVPMQRIHIDFAGPFLGKIFLIMIDAYSKWPEVHVMREITAKATISKCRQIFAAYGLPQVIVTDNGRTFTSHEFQQFLLVNGIKHKTTAPYSPATNGQAERFVQTMKQALKRMKCDTSSIDLMLSKMLLQYRSMFHAATNKTPAKMFIGRKLSTRLDLLRPIEEEKIVNQNKRVKVFACEERVACKNYVSGKKWQFGKIVKQLGRLHYKIMLDDGRFWVRHINQIRSIGSDTPAEENMQNNHHYWDSTESNVENQNIVLPIEEQPEQNEVQQDAPAFAQVELDQAIDPPQQTIRRSIRVKMKPKHLSAYVSK